MTRFGITPAVAFTDKRLTPRDVTVLGAIGTFSDKNGYAFPSLSRVGGMLGITRQAVQKSLSKLVDFGYVERRARARRDGSQTSSMLRVLMDVEPPEAILRGATPGVAEGATAQVAEGATPEVAGGATAEVARKLPNEHPNQHLIEHPTGSRAVVANAAAFAPICPECVDASNWEIYLEHRRDLGHPIETQGDMDQVCNKLDEILRVGGDVDEAIELAINAKRVLPLKKANNADRIIEDRMEVRRQQLLDDADMELALRGEAFP